MQVSGGSNSSWAVEPAPCCSEAVQLTKGETGDVRCMEYPFSFDDPYHMTNIDDYSIQAFNVT